MKRIVQLLTGVFAFTALLLAGCSNSDDGGGGGGGANPPAAPTAENIVSSGTDMKDEFFLRYGGGNFNALNHGGRASGLANGGERLSLNANGTYELVITDNEMRRNDNTNVKCTVTERGTITQVRRIKDSPATAIAASTATNPASIEAAIVLKPDNTEVVRAEQFVQGGSSSAMTDEEVRNACMRTAERVILVEQFFPDGILLANARVQGETETNNQGFPIEQSQTGQTQQGQTVQGQAQIGDTKVQAQAGVQIIKERPLNNFFLDQRLLVRQGVEWVWVTGPAARQAVEESSRVFQTGTNGLEVEGDRVQSLEAKEGEKNVLGRLAFTDGNHMEVEFGTQAVGRFLPLLQASGDLLGVSYNVNKGDVAYNLANYRIVTVTNQLQDLGMNKDIEKTLQDAQRDIEPHHRKLETQPGSGKVLMIDVNVKERDRIKVRSKAPEAPTRPATQAGVPL